MFSGVDQERGTRLVQRPFGDQPVTLRVRENGPFLVDITILAGLEGDSGTGLTMAAECDADLQAARLEHPCQ
jgi:hypothetical protein